MSWLSAAREGAGPPIGGAKTIAPSAWIGVLGIVPTATLAQKSEVLPIGLVAVAVTVRPTHDGYYGVGRESVSTCMVSKIYARVARAARLDNARPPRLPTTNAIRRGWRHAAR